jgi:hypothetical protein
MRPLADEEIEAFPAYGRAVAEEAAAPAVR